METETRRIIETVERKGPTIFIHSDSSQSSLSLDQNLAAARTGIELAAKEMEMYGRVETATRRFATQSIVDVAKCGSYNQARELLAEYEKIEQQKLIEV